MWKQGPQTKRLEEWEKPAPEREEPAGRRLRDQVHRISGLLLHAGEQSQGEVPIHVIRPGSGAGMEWDHFSSQPEQSQVSVSQIIYHQFTYVALGEGIFFSEMELRDMIFFLQSGFECFCISTGLTLTHQTVEFIPMPGQMMGHMFKGQSLRTRTPSPISHQGTRKRQRQQG